MTTIILVLGMPLETFSLMASNPLRALGIPRRGDSYSFQRRMGNDYEDIVLINR